MSKVIEITQRSLAESESKLLVKLTDVDEKRMTKKLFKQLVKILFDDAPAIKLVPVSSSTINQIGYEPVTEVLRVEFHSGAIYDYIGVPADEYDSLKAASSVGKHLNAHIKPNYGTVKIK